MVRNLGIYHFQELHQLEVILLIVHRLPIPKILVLIEHKAIPGKKDLAFK